MKSILTFLLTLLFSNILLAQSPTIEWKKNVSKGNSSKTIETVEKGFASLTTFKNNIFFVKSDKNGNTLWEYQIENTVLKQYRNFIETKNGDFVLVGIKYIEESGNNDIHVIKLNKNGELLFEKNYGGSGIESAIDVVESNDGNIIIVGFTDSVNGDVSKNNGFMDVWVVKINNDGSLIWEKSFGGTGQENPLSITNTNQGYWIMAETSGSTNGDLNNPYHLKGSWNFHINEMGEITKQIVFSFISPIFFEAEDGYLTLFYDELKNKYSILKFNLNGDYVSTKDLDIDAKTISIRDIVPLSTNEFICYGSNINSLNNRELYVLKLDSNFNKIWDFSLGSEFNDYSIDNGIKVLSDGNYLVFGNSLSYNVSSNDEVVINEYNCWAVKLSEPNLSSEEFNVVNNSIVISPNPTKELLNIKNQKNIDRIYIYNYLGQMVYDSVLNSPTATLNINNFNSGNYIIKLETEGKVEISKFIKD